MKRLKNCGVLWRLFWLMICVLVGIMPVCADELLDPTKPDDAVLPFIAGNAALARIEPLHLTGVQLNGKDSVAIVNDTVLRVGQEYQGYTVKAINRTRVLLTRPAQQSVSLLLELKDYRTPAQALQTANGGIKCHALSARNNGLNREKSSKESVCHE